MAGRRRDLSTLSLQQTTNVGLWLDRFVTTHGDDGAAKRKLIEECGTQEVPEPYTQAFIRWTRQFKDVEKVVVIVEAGTRWAVGLGAESVLETSITLHRTYGVPYVPGPALKGLTSHFCQEQYGGLGTSHGDPEWLPSDEPPKDVPDKARKRKTTYFDEIFGHTGLSGGLIFHDAWFIPGSVRFPLLRDVMTVHHPDYYAGAEDAPPADWDDPIPVRYVDVRPGAWFLVVIEGRPDWGDLAARFLMEALAARGIGAKSASSGYGRGVKVAAVAEASDRADVRDAVQALFPVSDDEIYAGWERRHSQEGQATGLVEWMCQEIQRAPNEQMRRRMARLLLTRKRAWILGKWVDRADHPHRDRLQPLLEAADWTEEDLRER